MRIRHFSFLGIRGLDGLDKDLPRTNDTDLVVVHGKYARGKTTFLDTLAAAKERIGEYGSPDGRWDSLVGSNTGSAKVKIDWELSDDERKRSGIADGLLSGESILGRTPVAGDPSKALRGLLTQRSDAERGSIHYLHDSRDLTGPVNYGAQAAAFAERMTTRNSKFAEIYDLLDQPEMRAAKEDGAKRFAELFPKLEVVGLRRTGISFVPMIRHRDSNAERSYHQLSSSEKQAFLIALYTAKAPIVDSVLMIDAPEIGFGDEAAVDLVQALLRWTQRTQLIVATASTAVRSMPETAHVVELP
jgi:ABC-type uncharacterized transport system ATPase subunit